MSFHYHRYCGHAAGPEIDTYWGALKDCRVIAGRNGKWLDL
jgi:hypothetical protein